MSNDQYELQETPPPIEFDIADGIGGISRYDPATEAELASRVARNGLLIEYRYFLL